MKALILTGGAGRSLSPFSATRPKAMTVVAGGSLMRRTLTHLHDVGVTDVTVVIGQNGDKVRANFQDGQDLGLNIFYVEQERPGGIADAILRARQRFIPGEYFVLVYGDVVTSANPFHQALQSFNSFKAPIACVCLPGPPTGRYGNVYLDGTRITKIVEKPATAGLGNYVLAGVFVLPVDLFTLLERSGNDMERVFEQLVRAPGLHASIWEEGWIDVEYAWDILAANRIVMDTWEEAVISRYAVIESNVTLSGPVRVERGSVIKAGAVLAGPCYIGRNCYVGNNVLVRSYSSLGAASLIGYGVELKNCVLFGNSRIGRLSFIGDSVIGENVDIGSGTMTINENMDRTPIAVDVRGEVVDSGLVKLGAFIGDDVKVGAGNTLAAGTVLTPGSRVPHHATVGGGR
jgi:UDP-N-acetylglucosamine diphosphorylase / glucose-1-phosphate thymidylyltransferase / UDP-N-acetylgalactosamine diphosphorylase / glucosamine-1-phosphate N-acetyltransferase / galactosamine-1-phosphate N-acetyltransferase